MMAKQSLWQRFKTLDDLYKFDYTFAAFTSSVIVILLGTCIALGIIRYNQEANIRAQVRELDKATTRIHTLEHQNAILLQQIEDESATLTALRQTNGVLGALSKTLEGVDIVPREAVRGKR